ncbi:DUF2264 domain-containing protein [Parapedobacter tibetensis]|uniref:DUF2264 domain-containing protein n=1 Tax=Parapedobacter tibetensis TaxID=2972951 RepID=UPI00214D62F5|nr:DUF2264 domain-containing protein [Parapedobacter tibetensis]
MKIEQSLSALSLKGSLLLLTLLLCGNGLVAQQDGQADRERWLQYLDQLARPVLKNLAEDRLKEYMPVELAPGIDNKAHRTQVAYLEAFGRTLSGIAPWLQLEGGQPSEVALRAQFRAWTLKAIANAVNPEAKDYLLWKGGQPLVDASFFALGLVRAPWIWENLDDTTRERVVSVLLTTRDVMPVYSNWILFSAMVEAFFCRYDLPYDPVRIEYALRTFDAQWYTGDGMYADGMDFRMDYYNSYVIQPYMQAILAVLQGKGKKYEWVSNDFAKISRRYAELQERFIHIDGSFPVVGRSIVYRGGAFQHLADMALRKKLPDSLHPAQVRSALTAVIRKTSESSSTFNAEGWLTIGLYGTQPALSDFYITTGSLYLCSAILLPLGLPETDEFWQGGYKPWTAVKIWSGENVGADHALDIK